MTRVKSLYFGSGKKKLEDGQYAHREHRSKKNRKKITSFSIHHHNREYKRKKQELKLNLH